MQITRLRMTGLLAVFQLITATAYAEVDLRVESRPIIQPDEAPGGQFQLDAVFGDAFENRGNYQVYLHRNYFASGRVCVTLRAFAKTATPGADLSINPAVHCWEDQDSNARLVDIQLVNDCLREGDETIMLRLVNPTGGAIVGPFGRAQVTLRDDV